MSSSLLYRNWEKIYNYKKCTDSTVYSTFIVNLKNRRKHYTRIYIKTIWHDWCKNTEKTIRVLQRPFDHSIQILNLLDRICTYINHRERIAVVFLDVEKAFNFKSGTKATWTNFILWTHLPVFWNESTSSLEIGHSEFVKKRLSLWSQEFHKFHRILKLMLSISSFYFRNCM